MGGSARKKKRKVAKRRLTFNGADSVLQLQKQKKVVRRDEGREKDQDGHQSTAPSAPHFAKIKEAHTISFLKWVKFNLFVDHTSNPPLAH